MVFLRGKKKEREQEHAEVSERLSNQERELRDMARRVRLLEIEAGIFKPPPLKEANGS